MSVIIGSINIACCIERLGISGDPLFVRTVVTWKTGNFALRVVNSQDGRSVHDSPQGFGTTHSILQRRINGKCLVEQSRHVSCQKTCVVNRPPTPPALVNAQTKPLSQELTKLTKRIRQFPGGVGVGAPGGPPGEEEEEGDLVTVPVEQWLKRMIKGSPSTPKPPNTPATTKGKAATTSKIPIKKGSPSTGRGDIRSRLEAVRERRKTWEKHLAESGLAKGKGKGKGKGPAREVERLKPLPDWEDWAKGKKLRRRLEYDSD